jgi:hypothetical protein
MSRLKIDMRFEALPSRRSIVKTNDIPTNDKKTVSSKDEKQKEDKPETNNQQNPMVKKHQKRSMKPNVIQVDDDESIDEKKVTTTASEDMDTNNKLVRKLLLGKTEPVISFFKRSNPLNDMQEKIDVKDISALINCSQQTEESDINNGKYYIFILYI